MSYRKLSANFILSPHKGFIKNGILIADNDKTVVELIDTGGDLKEESNLEYYNGILVPGFVNANSSLELSFLKGQICDGKGWTDFITEMSGEKQIMEDMILRDAINADKEMRHEGIRAAADISINNISDTIKYESPVIYKTFTCLPAIDYQILSSGLKTDEEELFHYRFFIHKKTFRNNHDSNCVKDPVILLQSMDSEPVMKFFRRNELFFPEGEKIPVPQSPPSDNRKICKCEESIHPEIFILPLSNYGGYEKEELIHKFRDLFFLMCPESDHLSGRQDIPVSEFIQFRKTICLGTGSPVSGKSLSIIDELLSIQEKYKQVNLEDLLKCATINGARALGIDYLTGSFEKGKRPGINLIENVDLQRFKLTPASKLRVLIS